MSDLQFIISAMADLPSWFAAVGSLLVIAAVLGTAVAVYRTNVQATSLREAERTMDRLRGEIGDYARREAELEGKVKLAQAEAEGCKGRVKVLEDLITKRQDDDEIRAEIAAVKKVVDENVLGQLTAIFTLLEGILEGRGEAT